MSFVKIIRRPAAQFEPGLVLDDDQIGFETDTKKFKIGDNVTTWANLLYADPTAVIAALALKADSLTAADATARLALTGLTRGARVYQTDTGFWYELTNAAAPSDAASWAIQRPVQTAVLEADFPKTNDTLANVTDLTLTLAAGRWYEIEGSFFVTGAAGGFKFDFGGGTVTATGVLIGYNYTLDQIAGGNVVTALDTAEASSNAGFTFLVKVSGTVQVNAGGTLIPRFAQAVTDVAAETFEKYSTLTAIDVTP